MKRIDFISFACHDLYLGVLYWLDSQTAFEESQNLLNNVWLEEFAVFKVQYGYFTQAQLLRQSLGRQAILFPQPREFCSEIWEI